MRPGDRALVRTSGSLFDQHFDVVVGDLSDPTSMYAACRNVESVFHCAGHAHAFNASDPEVHWRINFEGTCNLLQAAGESGVKRFVFLSSVKAMAEPGDCCVIEDWPGEPATSYGKSKRAAEQAVLAAGVKYGMHVVNLRLAMVYGRGGRGNLERMAGGIRAGWFPPLPETGNKRSLVHVDDVVEAIRLVAERPEASGRTYIVADSQAYSGRELYDSIRAVLPASTSAVHPLVAGSLPRRGNDGWAVPASLLRAGGLVGDAVGKVLHRPLPLNSEVISRLLDSACYQSSRIHDELGWVAKISLHEGIHELLHSKAVLKA